MGNGTRIVVTGVAGSVGSRVATRLAADAATDVIGLDRVAAAPEGIAKALGGYHVGDLRSMDLDEVLEDADVLVHLASAYGRSQFVDASSHDTRSTSRLLAAAERSRVGRVVLLSSAMVYGARPENPIPLTERAPVQPGPLAFAECKVTIERLGRDWQARSDGELVVLRPSTAVAPGGTSWVARSLQLAAALSSDSDPHLQFLHLDDLAAAVVTTATVPASGIYNVAPDGWVRADEVRTLSGRAPRLRIPEAIASEIVRFSWERGIVATPPGIMPYATNSWVVANDRLRGLGWEPSYSNVEAYVDADQPRPWAMINARQRQQLAMGGAGAVGAAVLWGLRAARRR